MNDTIRRDLEATTDEPPVIEASEESYTAGVKSLAKHFLKALDEWTDFDSKADWRESTLGNQLYERCQQNIPERLRSQLTGAQVGMAAHVAYRAFIQSQAKEAA